MSIDLGPLNIILQPKKFGPDGVPGPLANSMSSHAHAIAAQMEFLRVANWKRNSLQLAGKSQH